MVISESNIDIRDAFFDEVYKIAAKDKNVIFLTADTDAFSLRRYKKDFPKQFINIGIAEQNMIAMAAGLALSGKKVFIYSMIPFITLRCYEHIKVNICSMNLPITIIGLGAGFSFSVDGPTHHAVCDISIMQTLPEITILNPCDSSSAAASAHIAYKNNSPVYIRIDKGKFPALYEEEDDFSNGFKVIREIKDVNIISTGFMTQQAIKVADELKKNSIDVGVIDFYRIKPVNKILLLELIGQSKQIITLEENSIVGGIGTIINEILTDSQKNILLKRIALKDEQHFTYGSRQWLHRHYGLDVAGITKSIVKLMEK
jgi:transketolase